MRRRLLLVVVAVVDGHRVGGDDSVAVVVKVEISQRRHRPSRPRRHRHCDSVAVVVKVCANDVPVVDFSIVASGVWRDVVLVGVRGAGRGLGGDRLPR